MSTTIAVEDLRIGMYIQLEGGWLSHPFPLSSFRIVATDQIATLRSLGLARVRWLPDRSAPDTPAPAAAAPAPAAVPADPVTGAAAVQEAQQRAWLAAQRAAARRCEQQYGEATQSWREAQDAVIARPREAGRTTEALSQAMLDKMLVADEIGIRLVGAAGDRSAAHALNVAVMSLLIGRALGLDEQEMRDVGAGALMHDVGKLEVEDRFRHVDDSAGAPEPVAYREHVAKGVLLGQRMALKAGALAVLAQHHEHVDGSGFPQCLRGEEMAIGARIVAIANRYDKLCNPATPAISLTPHEAVAMLFVQDQTRFDPAVLAAFIRVVGVYPAGSLVQLTDDRYAIVVGVNPSRPLKPRVLVHDAPPGRGGPETGAARLLELGQESGLGIRRSLPQSKLPPAVLRVLDARPRVAYFFAPVAPERPMQALAA